MVGPLTVSVDVIAVAVDRSKVVVDIVVTVVEMIAVAGTMSVDLNEYQSRGEHELKGERTGPYVGA